MLNIHVNRCVESKWINIKTSKLVFVSFLSVFLFACQTVQEKQISQENQSLSLNKSVHLDTLSKMQNWRISGKLGFITPEKRSSVYLNWKQTELDSDIKMTNVLGVQLARIKDSALGASLESDGQTYFDDSPEALIFQVSGWELPVSALTYWIKGLPKQSDNVTYLDSNLVNQIKPNCQKCDAWEINYSKYKLVDDIWLPHRIRLVNASTQTRLNFNINKWAH